MYRDFVFTSRHLQTVRFGEVDPAPRRRRRRSRLILGALFVRVGERLTTSVESPVGSRA